MNGPALENATLVGRVDVSESIARFFVRPDVPAPFVPGQYLSLGVSIDGRLLQRPYSTAVAPGSAGDHEFLIRRVRDGAFTPLLWDLPVGQRVRLGRAKGLFMLQPEDRRTHLFVATGTGLAPFISMLQVLLATGRPPRAVVVHGVSHVRELAYVDRLAEWDAAGVVTYVPAISRPDDPSNAGWTGRSGRLGAVLPAICAELDLGPASTVAYLCGNPEMIAAGERILVDHGLDPAAVRSENYWANPDAEPAVRQATIAPAGRPAPRPRPLPARPQPGASLAARPMPAGPPGGASLAARPLPPRPLGVRPPAVRPLPARTEHGTGAPARPAPPASTTA